MCVCVSTCVEVRGQFAGLILFLQQCVFWDQIQVTGLGNRCIYPLNLHKILL